MVLFWLGAGVIGFFVAGIRIVRPTHRAVIERLGRYNRFGKLGFNWVFPLVEKMYQQNVTEQMVDAEPQEIITNDNLNARVDAQVSIAMFPFVMQEKRLIGSVYGSGQPARDIPRLVSLYQAGRLKLSELVSRTYTLDQVNDALAALAASDGARGIVRW